MVEKISVLSFKLLDPVEAGEPWALSYGAFDKVVDIVIDDKSLLETIRAIEMPYMEAEGFEPEVADFNYGHRNPRELYYELSTAESEEEIDSFAHEYGAELYCCADCGESGCWSVLTHIRVESDFVYWFDFEQNHRDWAYNLEFKFKRTQYDQAMSYLKRLESIQKKVPPFLPEWRRQLGIDGISRNAKNSEEGKGWKQ